MYCLRLCPQGFSLPLIARALLLCAPRADDAYVQFTINGVTQSTPYVGTSTVDPVFANLFSPADYTFDFGCVPAAATLSVKLCVKLSPLKQLA